MIQATHIYSHYSYTSVLDFQKAKSNILWVLFIQDSWT